jgi:peptidoglycan lytic transglycosylase
VAGRIGRNALVVALALSALAPGVPARAADESGPALREELSRLLRGLTATAAAADRAGARWVALQIREMELRAAEEAARIAFEERVRQAYIAGPGRAVEFLLSSSDLHEFAARLPYASGSLALGHDDVAEVAASRAALQDVLEDADRAQRDLAGEERRLGAIRVAIERRLADAERSAGSDLRSRAEVGAQRKRYAGTLDRVAGATRAIRYRRGEAMFAAASPFLGPRGDCSIPKGLRSTGDRIAGGASWYGNAFAGKPTASGAIFHPERYTVAHRTLPFGLFLLIRYGDRCVVSFLNDRGPYVDGRILDLSYGSARAVGLTGVKSVSATLLVRAR